MNSDAPETGMALASAESQRRIHGGSGGLRRGRDTREVAFDGALGTVANTKEGELSPPAKLMSDDVSRAPLYCDPAGHGVVSLVSALTQSLLCAPPVSH